MMMVIGILFLPFKKYQKNSLKQNVFFSFVKGQNHFQRCVQFFENDKRKGNTILKIKTIFLCSHVKMYIRVYG